MTLSTLDTAIQAAEREFERLSAGRWRRTRYLRFNARREAGIGVAADRIARLLRFRGHLFAKQYALDLRD